MLTSFIKFIEDWREKKVQHFRILLVSVLALTLLMGTAAQMALAIDYGPSSGFVQYRVSANLNGISNLFSLNSANITESAKPSGTAGLTDITVSLSSNLSNLTYSKDVNTTSLLEIFPYVPTVTNQSIAYQTNGFTINLKLTNVGTIPITFNGTTYQATKYLVNFSVANASTPVTVTGNGSIISMPSGLVDTAQISLSQTATVNMTLESTNLSLNSPASHINPVGVSLLGIALAAAVAIAAPTIYKIEKKKHEKQSSEEASEKAGEKNADQESPSEKPSYWVD